MAALIKAAPPLLCGDPLISFQNASRAAAVDGCIVVPAHCRHFVGIGGFSGCWLLHRFVINEVSPHAEEIFRRIQIGTSCYVALAQGANDVGGLEAVNFRIVFQIMLYWILTVPAAAGTSMLLFFIFSAV
ncbi:MAG: hypothetical protein C4519_18065 [Desulfobacteraceae bacterium]|nr:MAG: hypothetical protein C4519_18065 [Desulfobacteraceae bacterium]